ncbi:MAG: hypothetical protein KGL39_31775, partial [Patescibacteria group bacterium]|nr:hypothetical protein [Patescibacteria group bacterium]
PSLRTRKLEDEICRRLMEGESLVAICKSAGMPDYSTVAGWLLSEGETGTGDDSFVNRYRRAREAQADLYAEKSLEVAARREKAVIPGKNGRDYEAVDTGAVQANRLEWDALRWYASKLAPKKYSDKQQVEHSGPNGGPIATTIAALTPEEQERRIAELQRKLEG